VPTVLDSAQEYDKRFRTLSDAGLRMTPTGPSRSRLLLFLGFLGVIALGMASRRFPFLFPAVLGKYPGDALWALMVFIGLAFLRPHASTVRLSLLAFAVSCLDEFSQLYQAPWINTIRHTIVGHLVLGSVFSWFDMVAYAVGVLIGAFLDILFVRLIRWRAARRLSLRSTGEPSSVQ
jgi:hypothetical protein